MGFPNTYSKAFKQDELTDVEETTPTIQASLERFLDYILDHERVWVCRRIDIARHWIERFPMESRT